MFLLQPSPLQIAGKTEHKEPTCSRKPFNPRNERGRLAECDPNAPLLPSTPAMSGEDFEALQGAERFNLQPPQ